MTERVRAEMRRSGGFTGRTVHVQLDSAQLPPADAVELLRLVGSLDLAGLSAADPPTGPGADLMRYDLTIEQGPHRWQGTVADPTVPPQLRPLLQFLNAAAP
ncbi:protealysin inhibitor emfourin [Micromonosporaceae bacterium Da 78-11]